MLLHLFNLVRYREYWGSCNSALWLCLKVFLSFWNIVKDFAMSLRIFAPEKFQKPFHLAASVPLRKDIVSSLVNFIYVLSANHSSGEIDCILSKRKCTLGHLKRPLHLQNSFRYPWCTVYHHNISILPLIRTDKECLFQEIRRSEMTNFILRCLQEQHKPYKEGHNHCGH